MLLKKDKNKHNHFNAESLIGGKNSKIIVDDNIYNIEIKDLPECSKACPAGINVKAYVNLIANRKFEEAVNVIRQANPFPAICGRICTRPCENYCEQGVKGDSISIRALKRYASDYEQVRRSLGADTSKIIYNEKIAIVGAGPAGLSAAVDLIRMGYPVTVFEAQEEPGGMLRYAIPDYRLPKDILKKEIDWIKSLGIKIKTGKRIKDPATLFLKGYSAILIAVGAPKSFSLGIDGKDSDGVIDPLLFLHQINTKCPTDLKGDVVVIGGGSTAFDVARSAIRLGAKSVTLAYRRGLKEMPANSEEIKDAKDEDVKILTLTMPKSIIVKKGKLTGIEFLKVKLGNPDESGRRRPIAINGSEFVIKADVIIPAIGAKPEIDKAGKTKITDKKGIVEIKCDGSTKVKGIFAAGDVETGPSSVVEAIGRGHTAAKGIDVFLRGKKQIVEKIVKSVPIVTKSLTNKPIIHLPKKITKKERKKTFNEVEKSLSEFEALNEASRCFVCGPCNQCTICLPNCQDKQLIAQIDNTNFLLKVPSDLSLKIYEKGPLIFKLKIDKISKSILLQGITAKVDKNLCIGCGRCEEVCSYRAINNVIAKGEPTYAEVNHDSCSSCSACVSVCPSGAITQGYMSDNEILSRLKEKITPFKGIKALISYWSAISDTFDIHDGTVEIMSARKPSPSFLIRALARSGRGLLVIGPDEQIGSHYLPWEDHPIKTVDKTKNLLKLVGISPDRIKYKAVSVVNNPNEILKEFSESLDKKNLGKLNISIPEKITCPIGEVIAILRIIGANPEIPVYDKISSPQLNKPGEIALFEGCLPLLQVIGDSHNLFNLAPTRLAIHKLLDKLNIKYGSIKGLTCPSKGLLQTDIENVEEIVSKISINNLKSYKKANPKKLILATPEAFNSFSKEKEFGKISSLPHELFEVIKNKNDFSKINKNVVIHRACLMEKDPFYESTKKLLKLIPGINIVEIHGLCGHRGFESLGAESKATALDLMEKSVAMDADTIVCTSPYCESHLLMCQREGSWRSIDIEITDVYKLLLSSLDKGDK